MAHQPPPKDTPCADAFTRVFDILARIERKVDALVPPSDPVAIDVNPTEASRR